MKIKRSHLLIPTALAAWLAAAGLALAAPAPVIDMALQPASHNGVVTVKSGDTIQGIAHTYRLSILEIAELNHLRRPYRLKPGDRLMLPAPHTYKVAATDTLYSVSRMYGVSAQKIVAANNLKAPYRLRKGQVLHIPQDGTIAAAPAPASAAVAAARPAAPKEVQAKTVQVWAPTPPGHVRLLKKPGPSSFTEMVSKLAHEDAPKKDNPFAPSPLLQSPEAAPPAPVVAVSHRAGFIWPVRGQVISTYGPKDGGLYNDGINIAAPRGTPVLAAADGTVAYIGHTLQSYGNLVLIRHGGGMITAYAHLNSVSVRTGMRVRRGEPIGSVGSTGTVAHAQLHFEVRHGTDTVDPRQYLG